MKVPADKQIRASVRQALDRSVQQRATTRTKLELRTASDGRLQFNGYATTFESEYDVWGGPPWGWTESVNRGAFTKTLSEGADVRFLVNHAGIPLARTKSGTLQLSEDGTGLLTSAPLDPAPPMVQDLRSAMDRGDLDQMSFGFYVVRQEWNDDETRRWLVELNLNGGDVSVVTFPANDDTSASLRSSMVMLTERLSHDPRQVLVELRAGGVDPLQLVRQAHAGLNGLARAVRADSESGAADPDEDPGDIASAIDAAIEEALEAWGEGNLDQAKALIMAAELASDALLALLGVADPDDEDEEQKSARSRILTTYQDRAAELNKAPVLAIAKRQLEVYGLRR